MFAKIFKFALEKDSRETKIRRHNAVTVKWFKKEMSSHKILFNRAGRTG